MTRNYLAILSIALLFTISPAFSDPKSKKSSKSADDLTITEAFVFRPDLDNNGIPDGDEILIIRGHNLCEGDRVGVADVEIGASIAGSGRHTIEVIPGFTERNRYVAQIDCFAFPLRNW